MIAAMTAMSPLQRSHLVASILKTSANHFAPTVVLEWIVVCIIALECEAFFDVGLEGEVFAVRKVRSESNVGLSRFVEM